MQAHSWSWILEQLLTKFQMNLGLHIFTSFANTNIMRCQVSFISHLTWSNLCTQVVASGHLGCISSQPNGTNGIAFPPAVPLCATRLSHCSMCCPWREDKMKHPRNSIAQMHSSKQLHIVSSRSTFGLLTDSARASFWPWLRAHFCRPSWLLCLSQSKTRDLPLHS